MPSQPDLAGRTLGTFSDYDGLLTAVRMRVKELQIAGEAFDEFAVSKLIGVRPSRRLANISMGPLFTALGVLCVMVEDLVTTARIKKRLRPRNKSYVRTPFVYTQKFFQHHGRTGGKTWSQKLTPAQRSEVMCVLAMRRWRSVAP